MVVAATMSNLSSYLGTPVITSEATANTVVKRDSNSTAKFGTPTDNAHPATKLYNDTAVSNVQSAVDTANSNLSSLTSTVGSHTTTLGNATANATPNTLALRDGSGRVKVADAAAAGDAVNKGITDAISTLLSALSTTVTGQQAILAAAASIQTAGTLVVRDGSGRFRAADPSNAQDVVTYGIFQTLQSSVSGAVTATNNATANATANTLALRDSNGRFKVADPAASGDAANKGITDAIISALGLINGFRLSISNGEPVPASNISNAGTLYMCPYVSNCIALYDSTAGKIVLITSAQVSTTFTLANNKPGDVFAYISSGALAFEVLAWTNATTRATALTYQNGFLCKSGDPTRRYIGTIYATGANQTSDSDGNRCVWNYYNRVRRNLVAQNPAGTWSYLGTVRAANANTTLGQGRFGFVIGVAEDAVTCDYTMLVSGSGSASGNVFIGLDSTSVISGVSGTLSIGTSWNGTIQASYNDVPGIGYHYLQALEQGGGSSSTTYTSTYGAMQGIIWN